MTNLEGPCIGGPFDGQRYSYPSVIMPLARFPEFVIDAKPGMLIPVLMRGHYRWNHDGGVFKWEGWDHERS